MSGVYTTTSHSRESLMKARHIATSSQLSETAWNSPLILPHAIIGSDAKVITKRTPLSSAAEWAICNFYGYEVMFVPVFMTERGGGFDNGESLKAV